MTAAVSGVPADALVEFARGIYGAQWLMLNPKVQEEILADYANGLAAALPSLREQIAAEVLGPVRALVSDWSGKDAYAEVDSDFTDDPLGCCADALKATLSAPVQAAEEVECGPCANAHPTAGCADVDCLHNCQACIDEHAATNGGDTDG